MSNDAAITKLKELRPRFEAAGVCHMFLFGSRATGRYREDSDLDLLLEVDPRAKLSLLDLVRLEHLAADATGFASNAVVSTPRNLEFVTSVQKDLVPVF